VYKKEVMIVLKELPVRKPNRLKGYDYSQNGNYFITVCAKERLELFATINVGAATCRPHVCLSNVGQIIDISIKNIPQKYPYTSVNTYVIMPNHLHLILIINNTDENNGRQVAAPTKMVNMIIGHLKRFVSIQCGYSVWQKSFHDHIIRNENEYKQIAEYIENNPERWRDDCFYPK
jgi:REP element-mobilizing transposase RayT